MVSESAMAVSQKKPPLTEACQRFAAIAVRKGFVIPEQARTALLEQLDDDLANKHHRLVGTILLQKGWITSEQVDLVLNELFPKPY